MNKKLNSTIVLCLILGFLYAQEETDHIDELSSMVNQIALDSIANFIEVDQIDTIDRILEIDTTKISIGQWDPTRRLQGRTAGLNVYANSYSAGASTKMTFRGNRSILNSNQPLVLLNGMPIDNSEWNNVSGGVDQSNRMIDIDPHMIESIDFEKGMSARAKYGIVGANGVISIKTKEGYKTKPKITLSSTISSSEITNLPELQYEFAQGRTRDGIQSYLGPETGEASSWGPPLFRLYYDGNSNYEYDNNGALTKWSNGQPANVYDPLEFFTTGINHNQSVQILGGVNKLSYAVVGSMNSQKDAIATNQFTKYNLGSSIGFRATEKLELKLKANFTRSNAQRSQTGSNLNGIMLGVLRTPVSFDNTNGFADPLNSPEAYSIAGEFQRSYRPGIYDNPYWSLNRNRHEDEVSRQVVQLAAKYELSEKFDLQFNVGLDAYNDFRKGGTDKKASIETSNYNGTVYERNYDFHSENIELSGRYEWIKNEKMLLKSTLSYHYNQSKVDQESIEGSELIEVNMVTLSNASKVVDFKSVFDNKRTGGLLAIDFCYLDYLQLDASIRQDYSNKFGDDTNGFLSYGLGFDFSILNFVSKNQKQFPVELILNGSYGRFGNEFLRRNSIGIYNDAFVNGDAFISGIEINGLELNKTIPSANLTAESTSGFDIGLDVLSSQRLRLGFLYYNEISSGLISNRPIVGSTGHSVLLDNIGKVSNKGFDIHLSLMPVLKQKFAWKLDVNFNKNKNQLEEFLGKDDLINLSGFTSSVRSVALEGHPIGVLLGETFMRNEAGQMIIDEDGFPIRGDRDIIGDPNPDWTMYIGNEIRIGKNLSISALVDIKQGGDMWCGTCGNLDYFGKSKKSLDHRWSNQVFEGVNEAGFPNSISVPLAPHTGNSNEYYLVRYGFTGPAEDNIFDTSWIRLRNVALSYDLKNIIGYNFFSEFTCSVFAQNLLLITDYPGIDPETNLTGNSVGFGIDYYNNPGTRTIGFNLKATF